jgi:hypothetical protein
VSAIPKPLNTRLAHSIKQDQRKGAVHGQQIINLQTAVNSLPDFPAAAVTAPEAAGAAYSEAQAASVVTAVNDLIAALQAAGILAS